MISSKPARLAIIVSHPIQYHAPLWVVLNEHPELAIRVFYTWDNRDITGFHDHGFQKQIRWDVPLLEGYPWEFVPNVARHPGTHHFRGLINPDLVQRVLAWQPDVVMVNGYMHQSHLLAMWSLAACKMPLLFRGDSHLLSPRGGIKKLLRAWVLRILFRRCQGFLYCGTLNRDYFRSFGVPPERLHFCPHVVDNTRFAADSIVRNQEASAWRLSLGIPPDCRVLLFAGKLQEKKQPMLLLDAFLAADIANTVLLFVGDGELRDALSIRAQSVRNRVYFLPFQNQSGMPLVYRLGDLFVLPSSHDETWGLGVNEAMCCGVPVLLSDQVGCGPDLVEPDVTGWIFPARNKTALVERLRLAMQPQVDLKKMGAAAQQKIQSWNLLQARDGIIQAIQAIPIHALSQRLSNNLLISKKNE
ncbi:MAG: glycosyltransferase family 4 protein [Magnetococcales bacterium]|nr:glycosyltransferase family 4 protein [Magnetococcales bacterium]